jgi:hypothetical protein
MLLIEILDVQRGLKMIYEIDARSLTGDAKYNSGWNGPYGEPLIPQIDLPVPHKLHDWIAAASEVEGASQIYYFGLKRGRSLFSRSGPMQR